MREQLRDATAADHRALDRAFAKFDLTRRESLIAFLMAHAIGMAAVWPLLRDFAAEALGIEPPSFPAMLSDDLSALGIDTARLPRIDGGLKALDPIGACYVVAGSRLGTAALAAGPRWGRGKGVAERYLLDRNGLMLWRALVGWLGALPADRARDRAAIEGARATFALFGEALRLAEAAMCEPAE